MKNPEAFMQMSKKGKTLMMFVSVSGTIDNRSKQNGC